MWVTDDQLRHLYRHSSVLPGPQIRARDLRELFFHSGDSDSIVCIVGYISPRSYHPSRPPSSHGSQVSKRKRGDGRRHPPGADTSSFDYRKYEHIFGNLGRRFCHEQAYVYFYPRKYIAIAGTQIFSKARSIAGVNITHEFDGPGDSPYLSQRFEFRMCFMWKRYCCQVWA